jgi:signal transduction histidine kinase
MDEVAHAGPRRRAVADVLGGGRSAQRSAPRRKIEHDIHHELGTVKLLASLLTSADDVGLESRERARQILGEIRWLHELIVALDHHLPGGELGPAVRHPIRLDTFAEEVVAAVRLSTFTEILLDMQEAWARVDRLDCWRALRNVLGNAVRAAGPHGRVRVRVSTIDGWVVVQVDDDGPGFGAGSPGLGLGIVQDLVSATGGKLDIHPGAMGGCCVHLRLPSVPGLSVVPTGGA